MKKEYIGYQYDHIRNVNLRICTPDDGAVSRYVIALHGFVGSMESTAITALAEQLTLHHTAVITFNYPGHGNDTQDALFSFSRCQADFRGVIRFAQELYPEAEWCGVFATSFGGFLTLHALDEIPHHVRIVLRAPAVNMPQVFARIVENEGEGMAAYEKTGSVLLGYDHKLRVPYSFWQELCEQDVFMRRFDREMLLIHGSRDDIVLPADTAAFCGRNPKIMKTVIEGADHLFQNPGELNKVMEAAVPYLMNEPPKT